MPMPFDTTQLPPRARSFNVAMLARPGDLDLHVPASAIRGAIPSSMRGGAFFSNGPGWTYIGDRLAHPFDGHGYVRRYLFDEDGSLRLRARFVRTAVYELEARAQRMVVRGLATNRSDRLWQNHGSSLPRNVANTTVYRWGDRLLTGWEGGAPYALHPDTLETLGEHTFGGLVAGEATLAHAHRDERRGRLLLCSPKTGRRTTVTFRELDREERVVSTRRAELPGLTFAHDFAFTDRFYVLGGNPLAIKPLAFGRMLLGAGTMLDAVRARPELPGELLLVPRDVDGPLRRVRLPRPAFVVHFANAFERDGDVIVDASIFHDFPFGQELGYAGPRQPLDPSLPDARGPQTLYRITVPRDSDQASWAPLAPHGIDFPRVHPDDEGRPTARLFGACRADTRFSDPFDSVIGLDLSAGGPPRLWTAPANVFVGEPVLVPGADGDEDHVVVVLSDGVEERTTLVVLRADALDAGPVAEVPLPLLPIAFHGEWDGGPSRARR
jgi:carotenoid cleavage dioxygenase-like enzyme